MSQRWGTVFFILVLVSGGCVTKGPLPAPEAMRPAPVPELSDDLNLAGLKQSLEDHIRFFRVRPQLLASTLKFGGVQVLAADYVSALREVAALLPSGPVDDLSKQKVFTYLRDRFECHEVQGEGHWGEVFMTSYFDPVIRASSSPTKELYRPIYAAPKDMVLIQLKRFEEVFPHWSLLQVSEQKSSESVVRGRLYRRGEAGYVVPYYSRDEIDSLGLLRGKGLEMAYADPLDIFIMQIQGSGTLQLENGRRLRVGYAAQNGYPYRALGFFLKDRIPLEQMSLQTIEQTMRGLPGSEAQRLMNLNPSYVFFQEIKGEPETTLGTPVRPGRTIATDRRYFPKGALAFLVFNRPIFADDKALQPSGWEKVGRFVMDQDTGGAIRGMGRLDLYWGRGKEAGRVAGVMKQRGHLCYFVPKMKSQGGLP